MKKTRKVPIENIFFMLSYIWDSVKIKDENVFDDADNFEAPDILADIFLKNIKSYLAVGLYREYISNNDELKSIKGKVDFKNSLNNLSFNNARAICEFDEFEANNVINRIIKSTAYKLYNLEGVKSDFVSQLNSVLLKLNNIDIAKICEQDFKINFHRNNYYTYGIIKICELINKMTMISEKKGNYKFVDVFENDEELANLFEKFVYKFYKAKEKQINMKSFYHKHVMWNVLDDNKSFLPRMELDILLEGKEEVIIIDTKYSKNFYKEDKRYENIENNKKFNTGHLYQIFAYLNNYETEKKLTGMLLYPESYTREEADYSYSFNRVSIKGVEISKMQIKTIDLSKKWNKIEKKLLELILEN